jgi:hypothetical protein
VLACLVLVALVRVDADEAAFTQALEMPAETPYSSVVVSDLVPITSDIAVRFNVELAFRDGGAFDVAEGITLTIDGSIDAPMQQVFTGPGKVAIGPGRVPQVYPQWWGARGDGEHDDTAAIQAAIDAVGSGVVYFAPGAYANTGVMADSEITLKGAGCRVSVLKFTPTEGACLKLPTDCSGLRVEGMRIATSGENTAFGIDGTAEYVRHFSMHNFIVAGFQTGVYIAQGMQISFDNGYISCYGMGEANGSVGLKLGDKALNKGCTTATVENVYFTNAETCFYNRAAPCVLVRPIFETCQIGFDSYTRSTLLGPFFAGCKVAAARMTDNGSLFVGPFPTEHTMEFTDPAWEARTSFLPDTFDSPMKLGPMLLDDSGEMTINGQPVVIRDGGG